MSLCSSSALSSERKAHIVLLGGQDTPSVQSLRERWQRSMSSVLPAHDLTVVEWPNPLLGRNGGKLGRVEIARSPPLPAARWDKPTPQSMFDRLAARGAYHDRWA